MARIELGEYRVQGLDYYYTLQGWLKGVNMPGSQDADDDPGNDGIGSSKVPRDAMAFSLGYYEGDYQPIGNVSLSQDRNQLWTRLDEQYSYRGLYNGNIAYMETDLPTLETNPMQAMLYRYDQLNRLVLARGLNQYDITNGFAARTGDTGPYDASYTYDPNGNLLTLNRLKQDGSSLDELVYAYTENTNRLYNVTDAHVDPIVYDEKVYNSGPIQHDGHVYRSIIAQGNATAEAGQPAQLLEANESITLLPNFHAKAGSGFHARYTNAANQEMEEGDFTYTYDAIGNLITDSGEGTTITWTPYGKVRSVTHDDGTVVNYRYDAAGNRIEKRVTKNNDTQITRYLRDASGNVLAIYKDNILIEQPVYGSSRLGQYQPKATFTAGSHYLGQRNYELSNHLGNVLAVVSDSLKITNGELVPIVLQQQDYYPFGLAMKGRGAENEAYRFGFNGKEKDQDFQNNYDYGFRIYNPSIAKFLSADPLTKEYPWYTPYQFAGNKPIIAIDLDGLEPLVATDYKTLEDLGQKIELRYYSDIAKMVYISNTFEGKTVTDKLSSSMSSQEDLKKARSANLFQKGVIGLTNPTAVYYRKTLEKIEKMSYKAKNDQNLAFQSIAKSLLAKTSNPRGTLDNTYLHVAGQAFITTLFGEGVADFAGHLHETAHEALMTGIFISDRDINAAIDNYSDLVNNQWGQEFGMEISEHLGIDSSTEWTNDLTANYLNALQEKISETMGIEFESSYNADQNFVKNLTTFINKNK